MTKTPNYKNVHNRFKLNGSNYSYDDLKEVSYSLVKEGLPFEQHIGDFLIDWHDSKNYITIKTSGSTGQPKAIKISKQAMVNSALATGDYLQLSPGDSALLCLPAEYVAGKMMLVRAMILGLEIDYVAPKATPMFDYKKPYTFSAMVPMQVENTINYLQHIDTLIVGGAPVSNTLQKQLQDVKPRVFETFGMTETVSHIAVRQLNHNSETDLNTFKTLPNISLSQDERGCMLIDAPRVSEAKIITNDIVKLHSPTAFEWLGRYDNVINTGGVKVFPEQIETKLRQHISHRFIISSIPDETLGEKVILVIEGEQNNVKKAVFKNLEKFEIPKEIFTIAKFSETANGKIQRQNSVDLIFNS